MTSKIKAYDVNGIQINVGDPVMCVGDVYGLTVGKTYTVESISENGKFVRVVGDNGRVDGWSSRNFRIDKSEIDLDASKFKAGDEVRVVGLENTWEAHGRGYPKLSVGDEAVVEVVVGGACVVDDFCYHPDDLELVKDEPIVEVVEDEPVKTSGEFTIGDMVKMTSNAPAHGGDISGLVGKVVGRRGHYWGVEFDHVTDDIAEYNPYLVLQSEMGHFDPKCEWQGDEFVLAIREPLIGTVYGNIARNRNRVLNAALDDGAARVPITGGISAVIRLTPEQIAQIKEAIK